MPVHSVVVDKLSGPLKAVAKALTLISSDSETKKRRVRFTSEAKTALRGLSHFLPVGQREPTFLTKKPPRFVVRNGRPSERIWGQRLENSFESHVVSGKNVKMPNATKGIPGVNYDPSHAMQVTLDFVHPSARPDISGQYGGTNLLDWLIHGTRPHEINSADGDERKLRFWYGPPLRWGGAVQTSFDWGEDSASLQGFGIETDSVSHPGVDPGNLAHPGPSNFLLPTEERLTNLFNMFMSDVFDRVERVFIRGR